MIFSTCPFVRLRAAGFVALANSRIASTRSEGFFLRFIVKTILPPVSLLCQLAILSAVVVTFARSELPMRLNLNASFYAPVWLWQPTYRSSFFELERGHEAPRLRAFPQDSSKS